MAKAHITTKSGTKITVEGTYEEVAALAKQLSESDSPVSPKSKPSKRSEKPRQPKPTPSNLIASLIDGGFFRKPRDLASIKAALEEMGHFFPVTTLSPILLRLIRKRQLRRKKDKKRWLYTG
ncbi:MAG: hypothetical protein ABSA97_07655 [Verrucomicrobiia bacterium]